MLFDIMSGQSTVDHPLCEECTDTLLNQLDDQLKISEEECRDYRNFLEKLETSVDEEDDVALDDELMRVRFEPVNYDCSFLEKEPSVSVLHIP